MRVRAIGLLSEALVATIELGRNLSYLSQAKFTSPWGERELSVRQFGDEIVAKLDAVVTGDMVILSSLPANNKDFDLLIGHFCLTN